MRARAKDYLKNPIIIITAIFIISFSNFCWANNVIIDSVTLEDRDSGANSVVVEFNVSWDNSWRDETNHDALWVFIKICEATCLASNGEGWEHGDLKSSGLNPADTAPGSNEDLDIFVPSDKVGAFLRRKAVGTGIFASSDVRLTVDYNSSAGVDDGDQIQLKVFAIEMVYIPESNFDIGDGTSITESTYAFHATQNNTKERVTAGMLENVYVDLNVSDDLQLISSSYGIGIDGNEGLDRDGDDYVDNFTFPVGYEAFYLMKYELSQGQWREFLNSLPQTHQETRTWTSIVDEDVENLYVMTDPGVDPTKQVDRQTIKSGADPADGVPYTFICDLDNDDVGDEYNDGEWIAMNYVHWPDHCAYADWAGLRPMSELEYEKACYGPDAAILGKNAWQTANVTETLATIVNDGEAIEVANTGNGLCNYWGFTKKDGPYRVGFTATDVSDREDAGSGYYGNMQLSGNLDELAVTVGGTVGRAFGGTHGDGTLTTTTVSGYQGNATNLDWPGITATTQYGVTAYASTVDAGLAGRRGSNYNSNLVSVSKRVNATSGMGDRGKMKGIRLARTAADPTYLFQTRTPTAFSIGDEELEDWSDKEEIEHDDDVYATVVLAEGEFSEYLKAQDFDFDIPSGATVERIIVEIEKKSSGGNTEDEEVQMIDSDNSFCDDNPDTGTWPNNPSSQLRYFYGDESDWASGCYGTATEMNHADVGVGFKVEQGIGENTISVDQIKMTIYYTE